MEHNNEYNSMDDLKRKNMNPENWTECELMTRYFDDSMQESVKLMAYHNLMIQLYNQKND